MRPVLITSLPLKIQWSLCTVINAPSFTSESYTVIPQFRAGAKGRTTAGAESHSGGRNA